MAAELKTVMPSPSSLPAPPAVWVAFARQGAWKNWVLLVQLAVIALFTVANVHLADRAPDVVLVTPDGKATYVPRAAVGDSILFAIQKAKGQPSEAEVLQTTRHFLSLVLGVNSSTLENTWPEALAMMDGALATKLQREYAAQRVLETWKAAQVRTDLQFESVELVERTDSLLHVRALLSRTRSDLLTGATPKTDRVKVDLVQGVEARTMHRPSGLVIRDFAVTTPPTPTPADAGAGPSLP
ncbi:hypothetical protein [Pyxidicoccus sp. MSG2]|uniref:hypothetical protein n=1 Tax=Pyxidicoccus sp. MSG2 TaxID=2996790 RepID=UPI00226F7A32|nr:hypothetical protein [Pyxidicoccus sp. MSG2]MCY1023949.1 hypothetical protein [Pyxidicoccus sp. MSG2]